MQEIERKILGINKVKLVEKLAAFGAQKIFAGMVRVKYFDTADRKIKSRNDLLRVREFCERGRTKFSEVVYKKFKGIRQGCKYVEETEVKIDGPKSFRLLCELFALLGFSQTASYEKRRELYKKGKIFFEIDTYPKIPTFLEIEAPGPADIENAIMLLGLQHHEQTAESISALIRRKYPELNLKNLTFKT